VNNETRRHVIKRIEYATTTMDNAWDNRIAYSKDVYMLGESTVGADYYRVCI